MICCISAQLLCACAEQQTESADKIYVGVTCYNRSDTFLEELINAFKDKMSDLEEENLDSVVTIRDAAGSQRTQNDQVRELIDAGCNVLCVNLVDRADPVTSRSSFSTENLWRRICSSGIRCTMWAQMQRNPV